jgi:hypothetical protein
VGPKTKLRVASAISSFPHIHFRSVMVTWYLEVPCSEVQLLIDVKDEIYYASYY